jgi:hypothetical protein
MSTDHFQQSTGSDAGDGPLDPSLRVVPADIFDVDPPYDPDEVEFAPGEFADRFLDRAPASWRSSPATSTSSSWSGSRASSAGSPPESPYALRRA